ncbi:MAG: NAD(P)/FAD-dependent oxidoreductase [Balneolaceae bacterium]|nr:MAG: NAD(P)/FAD-dependent oxidoreductase [Balneolaceae bacterium]
MKIIIIGGGFGGLTAAKALAGTDADITLIDRTNHHLFQPLLYQVATAALAPGDIAVPIRSVFSKQKNVNVLMGDVTGIDRQGKKVIMSDGRELTYHILVMAPGARHSYFGNDDWEQHAPGLKTLADALELREHLLRAYETAENMGMDPGHPHEGGPGTASHPDTADLAPWLTFVVVGGGPTGVELAGAIAEISKKTMMRDFRHITPHMTRIILVEGQSRILTSYSPTLSERAKMSLERLGVEVLTEDMVKKVDNNGVSTTNGYIPSKTVIWAAGNQASPLLKTLDTELDRAGRARVSENLSLPDDPDIFVIGDAAVFSSGDGILPGIAPVAMQQARFVAEVIKARVKGAVPPARFHYNDKGSMATIGRGKAIAEFGRLKLSGASAWLMWSFVHIFFLIGFRNRFRVMIEWIWYYITFKGGFRLITGVNRDKQSKSG